MLHLLEETQDLVNNSENMYANNSRVQYYDSLLLAEPDNYAYQYYWALDLLRRGDSELAAEELKKLMAQKEAGKLDGTLTAPELDKLASYLALSHLRFGEQENCILNHTASSCLFPIQPAGFHQLPQGSRQAIEEYEEILRQQPDDLSARWLLNVAYMTLGEYPDEVPQEWLIPDSAFQSEYPMKEFPDIAHRIGFDFRGRSGGLVVDDFTNDGYLDILISEWGQDAPIRFFVNNADGTFTEQTNAANLTGLFGGLNLVQADYNNDGWLDVFVLRGAWLQEYGQHPNSLLKNNGDGTFTDVTIAANILSFHPTQTATWSDFNRDGWLDLFIGNETSGTQSFHPCEMYLNNQDGTFSEIAEEAGVAVSKEGFRIPSITVKGVTSGDFNNDGWPDLYVSTSGGSEQYSNYLFQNNGSDEAGVPTFSDVTQEAQLGGFSPTFATWFWDYDQDGWLDIFAAGYWPGDGGAITTDIAAEYLELPHDAQTGLLFRNNQDGTFSNVSEETNLDRILYAMGANYGDLDNDGWLDMYLGTGDPMLASVIPNRVFRNAHGEYFQDVTTATGMGHLQKGHAIAFSDIDNDGDQDLLMSMGGAYEGDIFQNAFFENPYQDEHNWITLHLVGSQSNRSAIGAKVVLTIEESGNERNIYWEVNSGGSFGASTLRVEVGLGNANTIKEMTVHWPNSKTQTLTDLSVNTFYQITEGKENPEQLTLNKLKFKPLHSTHNHTTSIP
ncbi:MAG: CRTAC1 family protein [Bacteroidota bacterium]